jgi:hypothetical protein
MSGKAIVAGTVDGEKYDVLDKIGTSWLEVW